MSRERRIADRERIRARVRRVTQHWRAIWTKDAAAVGRLVNHGLQVCSCYICGNPRRHSKGDAALTMAERRQAEAERELA
jgi:hypothetical protein